MVLKMISTSEVTAVLIVLNNIQDIEYCMNSLIKQPIKKIIVIDGGSTDGTLKKLNQYDCEIHNIGKTGLAHSRQYGSDLVDTNFTLLVDSDNVLDAECTSRLLYDVDKYNCAGVAAQKYSYFKNNILALYQEWMNSKNVNIPGEKLVIGTPALYRTNIIRKIRYDVNATIGDDTDFCYRLAKHGYQIRVGSGICYERMQNTVKGFIKKAYFYGQSDSQFFIKYREKRWNIGTHAIRNYLLKMSFYAVKDLKPTFLCIVFLYSFSRISGLYFTLLRRALI